jgi:putative hydrolase of the HAD superfamily
MKNNKIKLVAFDLDDCLFNSTDLSKKARIKGIDAMIDLGLRIDRDWAIQILMEVVDEYGSNFAYHYDYFFRRIEHTDDSFNISFDTRYKCIAGAVMAYHKEKIDSIKLYDDVRGVLKRLKKMNLKTAIITDGRVIKQYEKVLRLGIDELIDNIIVSDEIGIKKPNKKLFEYCLSKVGVESEEAIYIGDRLDKDIKPATELDMHSVYIHRGGKHDFNKTDVEKSEKITPDFEISDMRELIKIVDDLNQEQ